MLIFTATGWRSFYNPVAPAAAPVVIKLQREWVNARNESIKEYNLMLSRAQSQGRMLDKEPHPALEMPDWAK